MSASLRSQEFPQALHSPPGCSICGRGGKIERGWCSTHYQRWRRTGDPGAEVPVRRKAIAGEPRAWLEQLLATAGARTRECIEWPFGMNGVGYGRIGAEQQSVPRLVCARTHGPCPPGHETAHSCGNRGCVNPLHLRWATPGENAADTLAHGTRRRGESHGRHKLTAADVVVIRTSTLRPSELARLYGVTPTCIWQVRSRRRWAWM